MSKPRRPRLLTREQFRRVLDRQTENLKDRATVALVLMEILLVLNDREYLKRKGK